MTSIRSSFLLFNLVLVPPHRDCDDHLPENGGGNPLQANSSAHKWNQYLYCDLGNSVEWTHGLALTPLAIPAHGFSRFSLYGHL